MSFPPPPPMPVVLPFHLSKSPPRCVLTGTARSWGPCVLHLPHTPGTSFSWWKSLNCPLPRRLKWHQYCPILSLGPLMLHGGGGLHLFLGIETLQITLLTTPPHTHIIGPDKAELSLTLGICRSRGRWTRRGGTTAEPPFPCLFLCSGIMEIGSSDSGQ